MNHNLLAAVLADLWDDVRNPAIAWQLAVLCVCIGLGWYLARMWRRALIGGTPVENVSLMMQNFIRVLTPSLILLLIVVAKHIMAKYQQVHLLKIAMPLVGSMALIRIAFFILRGIFSRAGTVGASLLLFEKSFAMLVWVALALYITGMWQEVFDFLDSTLIPLGRHKVSLTAILQAALSALLTVVLALWAGAEIEARLMRMDALHSSLRAVAARTVRAGLILVAVLISLSLVGIDLTVLSVFGGALGVGIGLGLQKIASSYVSGFVILLDRSLKIGDMINVDKFYGRVTQINTRYTVLQGLDGTETIIPNEMLVSGVVQNFSLSDTSLRLAVRFTVGYQTDVEALIPQLETVAAGVPRVMQDPAPQAILVRFAEDGVELEVGFWIVDPENGRGGVSSDVNRAIWRVLKENNVVLPFPQREIRIVDDRNSSN